MSENPRAEGRLPTIPESMEAAKFRLRNARKRLDKPASKRSPCPTAFDAEMDDELHPVYGPKEPE